MATDGGQPALDEIKSEVRRVVPPLSGAVWQLAAGSCVLFIGSQGCSQLRVMLLCLAQMTSTRGSVAKSPLWAAARSTRASPTSVPWLLSR